MTVNDHGRITSCRTQVQTETGLKSIVVSLNCAAESCHFSNDAGRRRERKEGARRSTGSTQRFGVQYVPLQVSSPGFHYEGPLDDNQEQEYSLFSAIACGLASDCSHWTSFLSKGLFDPILFLLVQTWRRPRKRKLGLERYWAPQTVYLYNAGMNEWVALPSNEE